MALAATTLTSGINTSSNPASTASVNPTASSFTLLWIGYAVNGGGTTTNGDTITPTGARGTWTEIDRVTNNDFTLDRRAIACFKGTGSVTNEAISITVTPSSGTWTETAWIVDEWTGQDGTTPHDAAVIAGSNTGTSGALPDVGTPGAGSRVTGAWFHETSEAVSGTGLTALGSVTGGSDLRTLHSFYDASDPQGETPTATWSTNSTWAAIGLIVNAAAGGGSTNGAAAYYHLHQ